ENTGDQEDETQETEGLLIDETQEDTDEQKHLEEQEAGSGEDSCSEETQNTFSGSPHSSFRSQSPECLGDDQQEAMKIPGITKHTYNKYKTVSYRKIRKGNTKQRIDEFESMMHA
uniref:Ermin n=1 Tax=Latimeria chalumnae TaxID=7897 RepID=H3ACI8_LATCH